MLTHTRPPCRGRFWSDVLKRGRFRVARLPRKTARYAAAVIARELSALVQLRHTQLPTRRAGRRFAAPPSTAKQQRGAVDTHTTPTNGVLF